MSEKIHPHSYKLIITELKDGDQRGFEIEVPALNAIIFGDTVEEALEGYMGYFDDEMKRRKKEKIPMPKPDIKPDAIKQIPLRIPERVYRSISEEAKRQGLSFNHFVRGLLEKMA